VKLVLDTNVVVSALLYGGSLARLRWLWTGGVIQPVVNRHLVDELIAVFAQSRFRLSEVQIEELLSFYLPYAEVREVKRKPTSLPQCRDANDQFLLELAASSKADALVSGDKDLLVLKTQVTFNILTPAQLLASV
jgi:uncharacterized protein